MKFKFVQLLQVTATGVGSANKFQQQAAGCHCWLIKPGKNSLSRHLLEIPAAGCIPARSKRDRLVFAEVPIEAAELLLQVTPFDLERFTRDLGEDKAIAFRSRWNAARRWNLQ
ncbi:MAG: hypothetical protein ACKPHU_03120, partial [Planctomycetaceae bacterium]